MQPNYKELATEIRKTVLSMIYKAQVSHIGSNFSCIDILTVLYEKLDPKKDKLVISKGWVAASIYALNVSKGYMPQEAVDTFCMPGSKYIGLIEPIGGFGLQFAGGSMGYGICAGVGFALAKKLRSEEGKVYVLMSDGELAIGTTWESLLIARQHYLKNLVVVIDANGYQAMGMTDSILSVGFSDLPVRRDEVHYIDGHDFEKIEESIFCEKDLSAPKVVWAKTIKGKGVSFMEGSNLYHYKQLSEDEYTKALKELHG